MGGTNMTQTFADLKNEIKKNCISCTQKLCEEHKEIIEKCEEIVKNAIDKIHFGFVGGDEGTYDFGSQQVGKALTKLKQELWREE